MDVSFPVDPANRDAARGAMPVLPSLEDYEKSARERIIPMTPKQATG